MQLGRAGENLLRRIANLMGRSQQLPEILTATAT
jgi:hypothetical protein